MPTIEGRLDNAENELNSLKDFRTNYETITRYHSELLSSFRDFTQGINAVLGPEGEIYQRINALGQKIAGLEDAAKEYYKRKEVREPKPREISDLEKKVMEKRLKHQLIMTKENLQVRLNRVSMQRRWGIPSLCYPFIKLYDKIYTGIKTWMHNIFSKDKYEKGVLYGWRFMNRMNQRKRGLSLPQTGDAIEFVRHTGEYAFPWLFSQDIYCRNYVEEIIDTLDASLGGELENLPQKERNDIITLLSFKAYNAAAAIHYQHIAPQILAIPSEHVVGLTKAEALKLYNDLITKYYKDVGQQYVDAVIEPYKQFMPKGAPVIRKREAVSLPSSGETKEIPLGLAGLAGLAEAAA